MNLLERTLIFNSDALMVSGLMYYYFIIFFFNFLILSLVPLTSQDSQLQHCRRGTQSGSLAIAIKG